MAKKTLGPLPKYWTIGRTEHLNLAHAMKRPLSGYIGGKPSEGYWVNQLADDWRDTFDVNFAVPCNSATSGLLCACMAAGIGKGDTVWVSTYTMSATAAAPMLLGANVRFMDIDADFFCVNDVFPSTHPKAIIVTNLFGCAVYLTYLRLFCDKYGIAMIEDNAQAPFATCHGRYAGTIGHMGVFSLNVHKHIQCGEGGVVVTADSGLAFALEMAINHGELTQSFRSDVKPLVGGNFRMTEPIAAIACAQLKKGPKLVQSRIELAETITEIFKQVSFVEPPQKPANDTHVYYMWAGKIKEPNARDIRFSLVTRLAERGVPFRLGYSPLLHKLFETDDECPVAEDLENNRLFSFEVCAYDPKAHHLSTMRDIILEEADEIEKKRFIKLNVKGKTEDEQRGSEGTGSIPEPR